MVFPLKNSRNMSTSDEFVEKEGQELQHAKLLSDIMKMSVMNHLKKSEKSLTACSVYVSEHDQQQVRALIIAADINDIFAKMQSLEEEILAIKTQTLSKAAELDGNMSELTSTEEHLHHFQKKRKNAEICRVLTSGLAIGAAIFVVSLMLTCPFLYIGGIVVAMVVTICSVIVIYAE